MATAQILVGNVFKRILEIPDQSVRTCITSPPYFNLRSYDTATWEGGDPECEHETRLSSTCLHCGARQFDEGIGLEDTPEEYIEKLVGVFREVRRVLTDDGTLWVNIGDSYAAGKVGRDDSGNNGKFGGTRLEPKQRSAPPGYKQKDLIGIPWMLAFALRNDGWFLRSDIIWDKSGNVMPESVKDRPTKSHEYVFLLTKKKKYFYDHLAIAEPVVRGAAGSKFNQGKTAGHQLNRSSDKERVETELRNKRDVWRINTRPLKSAHFAVMPEALVEPCVLAGSSVGDMVLDPFSGSGTVGVVSLRHGRSFIGIELNDEYADLSVNRIEKSVDGSLVSSIVE